MTKECAFALKIKDQASTEKTTLDDATRARVRNLFEQPLIDNSSIKSLLVKARKPPSPKAQRRCHIIRIVIRARLKRPTV